MTDTLDASVSKLLVVGGRAVNASPPGALVEPPPRRAARGREADTLFLLIVPAGGEQAQAAFYEDLAHRAGEAFFAASGSVTSALRETVSKLNDTLRSGSSEPGRYQVGLAALVLRGADCYIARVGGVLSLIRQDGVLRIDPELTGDGSLPIQLPVGTPLGGSAPPDIKFAHYTVAPDQVVVLADGGFATAAVAPADPLNRALGAPDLPTILNGLKPLAGQKAQALIIRFAASNAPANLNGLPALRPRVESFPNKPPSSGNSGGAAVSATSAPVMTIAPVAESLISAAIPAASIAPEPVISLAAVNRPTILTVAESPVPPPSPSMIPIAPNVAEMPAPALSDYAPAYPAASAQAVDQPIAPAPRYTPTPTPIAAPLTEPAITAPPVAVHNLFVRLIRLPFTIALAILRGIARLIALILDRLLPESADGRTQIPIMTAVSIAILIPVLVVGVTVGLKFSQIDQTNFEKLIGQLQDQAKQAQGVPPGNPTLAKRLWQGVLQNVADAEQQRPGDPALEQMRTQAVTVLDQYEHVTRRAVVPVRVFGTRSALGAVLVQGGADIYTLDKTDQAVYRDTLRQPGVLQTHSVQPITQSGTALSGYSVKSLAAMIWMEEGGIRTSHALVALDPQGFLVTYSPILATAVAQPLLGAEQWKTPVAMRAWQGRLYILDPKSNQIWRYVAVGTTYPNTPEEYFTSDYQRNLAQAVDFAIDDKGNVYILFADGALKEYTGGVEQIFTPANLPDGKLLSGGALYLDASTPLPALYMTDPADGSIYEFTLGGTFQARFKALDPRAFDHMTGLFVQGNSVYVTAGATLYYFSTQ